MLNKRLIDMDLDELGRFLDQREERLLEAVKSAQDSKSVPDTVRGIDGIAALFGCSRSTAQRMKSSGALDDAIFQVGRTIICDKRKALEIKGNQ